MPRILVFIIGMILGAEIVFIICSFYVPSNKSSYSEIKIEDCTLNSKKDKQCLKN
jgi:hypothetical protein